MIREKIGRMNRALLIFLVVFVGTAAAQGLTDDSNISCVSRLDIPLYPSLAAAARLQGSVIATARVGADGSAKEIEIDVRDGSSRPDLFASTARQSLRSSRFAASCAGRAVRLIFEFALGEEIVPRVAFAYPNHFTILAPARVIESNSPLKD